MMTWKITSCAAAAMEQAWIGKVGTARIVTALGIWIFNGGDMGEEKSVLEHESLL